jgi:hypothetical protein
MNKVEVHWPSGAKQEFHNIAADAIYEINEEQGLKKLTALAGSSK